VFDLTYLLTAFDLTYLLHQGRLFSIKYVKICQPAGVRTLGPV
jgi:hypothetical protein